MVSRILARFLRDERGIEAVEYAAATALIIAGAVVALGALAESIGGRFMATIGLLE